MTMRSTPAFAKACACFILASLASPFAAAQCSRWLPGPAPSPEGAAGCMLVTDLDGAGPLPSQLIVGGDFERAGGPAGEGTLARNIAAWDGTNWSTIGEGLNALSPGLFERRGLFALANYNGSLYAAGSFGLGSTASFVNVARFTGTNWVNTGVLFDRPVHGLAVYGGELIACGDFNNAGPTQARRIAAWNGATWRPLASGLRGRLDEVRALAVYGGELIAAGSFDAAGAVSTPGIARWNGTRWTSLGSGVGTQTGDEIEALALYGGELYAAGDFREASGVQVGGIARWNGTRWAAVGDATRGWVETLTLWNGELVATGDLRPPGVSTSRTVAKWNGTRWASFGDDQQIGGYPATGASYNGTLYIGGSLSEAGGVDVEGITSWNGSAWTRTPGLINDDLLSPNIKSLAIWNGGLMFGGLFNSVSEFGEVRNLGRWTGLFSDRSGVSADGAVLAMLPVVRGANIPDDLVVAGEFASLGFQDTHSRVATLTTVADINGRITRPMGAGFNATVWALGRFNGAIIAAGDFTTSGATAINRLARFDGTNWLPMDALGGVNGSVRAIKGYNINATRIAMLVGGNFTTAGGAPATRIAQYSLTPLTGAASWSALGAGFNNRVDAIERFGGVTYAAGSFTADGNGVPLNRIARFVGGAWQQVGDGFNGSVAALFVDGPYLYAGGTFTASGATAVTNLARWDGAAWTPVDGGANGRVSVISRHRDELTIGGFFTRTGPGSSGGPRSGAVEAALLGRYTLAGNPWFAASDVPAARTVCGGGFITISAPLALGYDTSPGLVRTWRRNGVPLVGGTTPHGSILYPFEDLTIVNAREEDEGVYDCVITTDCGNATSAAAILSICPVDINCDDFVDFFDYGDFVNAFESGTPAADFNRDGFLDFFDYDAFVEAFEAGC